MKYLWSVLGLLLVENVHGARGMVIKKEQGVPYRYRMPFKKRMDMIRWECGRGILFTLQLLGDLR